MKIAALGRTQMLYDSIQALERAGHEIVLIGTSPAVPEYTRTESDFSELAKKYKCPFFCDIHLENPQIHSLIRSCKAEVAVSINWLTIIPKDIRDIFGGKIINAHAGDLPRYRGNAVPNWAILSGERKIVLTLHYMVDQLDAGPILLQKNFPIDETTYIGDVYRFLESSVPDMFCTVIKNIENGTQKVQQQSDDPCNSLRCYPRLPCDSEINWSLPAKMIHRLVRAVGSPFSGAYTFMGYKKIIVWKARYEIPDFSYFGIPGQVAYRNLATGEVGIITGEGFLILEEVEIKGMGRKKPADIISSIRIRLGLNISARLEDLIMKIDNLEKKALK